MLKTLRAALPTVLFLVVAACAASDDSLDEDDGMDEGEDVGQAADDLAAAGRWQPPAGARPVGYDAAPRWKSDGSSCRKLLPGTEALRRKINATYSGVNATPPYNCRPQRNNPNVTSVHGIGRAIDIMIPMQGGKANRRVGDPVANYLAKNAKSLGVQYIIWDRTSWGATYPNGKLYSAYKTIPHADHIHVELDLDGAK
jgi:hypothetical protein